MRKRKISLFIILVLITSTTLITFLNAKSEYDFDRADGCISCHSDTTTMSISVNVSSVDVGPSETFDISISLSGHDSGKQLSYAFWHNSGDGISEPVPLGSPDGDFVYSWMDTTLHYHATWTVPTNPNTEDFRITAPSSTGTTYLYIRGVAKGGKATNEYTITINVTSVDNTPPDVAIISPTNNSYVSGSSIAITGTATDSGSGILGSSVEAYVTNITGTNNTISLSYTGPGYSGTWDSTSVFDGDYNITVRAQDNDGNTNVLEYVTVKVDNTSPSITIDSVIPNPSNGITTITVFNSSSDIDGNGLRATITDPSSGEIYVNLDYQGSNLWNGTFTVTQNGNYEVNINATDYAGNTGYDGPASITGDVEAPIISIVSVLPNPSNGVTIITASNSSADIDANGIWATVTTPSFQSIYVDLDYQGGNFWNQTFIVVENGIYRVNINATDNASNTGYAGPVDITGDITAPQVNIENPANDGDQIGGSVISISGSAFGTGSNILNIYINDSRWGISNQPQTNPSGSNSGPFIFNNNTNIPIGFYWIAINITDQAGNVNVSYRRFEVISSDINPPILVITSINPNPSNGFTIITVISNEPLKGIPLLNITLPSSTVIYRTMFLDSPLTWRTNYTVVSNGLHTININGTDNTDNVGYVSATFSGDVAPPIIYIDTLLPNPSNDIIIITASNSSSDINDNGIWATITTPSFQSIFVELNYQGGNIWNGTFTVTENGDYTVNLNATDYANNTGYAGPLGITGDLASPSISIVNALPNPSDGLVIITATNSSSDIDEDGIWAKIMTPSSQSIFVELNYQGGNIWNGTFIVVENGLYTITINATDIAGNTGYAGPININGDVISPVIDINSPQQGILFGTNAPAFNITITEPNLHSTWYRLYNGTSWSNKVSFSGLLGTIETLLWNSMPNGVITIRFYANDTLGNTGYRDVNVTKNASPSDQNDDIFNITIIIIIIGSISALPILIMLSFRTKRFKL